MMAGVFLQGLAIGFSLAVPVGPVGLLCVQRTLVSGRAVGLASGLDAAMADARYSTVVAFGFTAVSGVLSAEAMRIRFIGSGVMSVRLERPPAEELACERFGLVLPQ